MTGEAREHSFDELTRGLASGSISRGKALKLMGAALVGGTLASLGMREAGADQCKRNGKACKKDKQCCSGNCDDSGTCADAPPTCGSIGATCTGNTDCCSELVCKGGMCAESCIPPNTISCDPNDAFSCDIRSGCVCIPDVSGVGICNRIGGSNADCTSSCECPPGEFCNGLFGECTLAATVCTPPG